MAHSMHQPACRLSHPTEGYYEIFQHGRKLRGLFSSVKAAWLGLQQQRAAVVYPDGKIIAFGGDTGVRPVWTDIH